MDLRIALAGNPNSCLLYTSIPKDEKVLPLIPAGKTIDDMIIEDCDK